MTKLRTAGAENRAFGRWAARYADQLGLIIRVALLLQGTAPVPRGLPDADRDRDLLRRDSPGPRPPEHGQLPGPVTSRFANVVTAVLAVGYTLLDLLDLPPLYDRVRPILEAQPEFPCRRARAGAPGRSPGPRRGLVPQSRPGRRDQGAQAT